MNIVNVGFPNSYWCVIFCLIINRFDVIESSKDYAEISSSDGNLLIRSAHDKNISFQTDRQCDVYINSASFTNAVSTVNRVDQVMKDYKSVLGVNIGRLRLHKLLGDFLSQYIDQMEGDIKKFEVSSTNPNLAVSLRAEIADFKSSVAKLKSFLLKNDCDSNPCKNGGRCQDLFVGFHCACTSGWEGISCEKDVNECLQFNSTDLGCQNGGICLNKPGSYECICTNGWHGLHCTTKATDCFSSPSHEICGHGTCVPQNNELGRTCICDQGWTKTNEKSACDSDVDECRNENPVCSKDPPVTCENTPGSFRCGSCPSGYTGNGQYCSDINECDLFNGGCSLNPKVQCINTPGSRKCEPCPPGYSGDGSTCIYQGVCKTNNGNCHPLATCIEYPSITESYAECRCPPGYTGNGIGPTGCLPYTMNACVPNPCKFGRCISDRNSVDRFRCICRENYYGKYCNHSIGMCFSNPCKNGGICINNNSTSYSCSCPEQYGGQNCETIYECGDLGIRENGTISFPSSRSSDLTCTWSISTEVNKVFNVSITQLNIGGDSDCNTEWLKISEGALGIYTELGKFCGTQILRTRQIMSTKSRITINYRATSRSSHFSLEWNSIIPQCHEIINLTKTSAGRITSPGWPVSYPVNLDCQWLLQAPAGKSIRLTFFNFDIGDDLDCTGDYLQVFSSFNEGKDSIEKVCGGSTPKPIITDTPEMSIRFHSDENSPHLGFQINYSLDPACGLVFKQAKGSIVPPNVTKELVCFYQIRHNLGLKTKLTFDSLFLGESDGCLNEYVAVYEGYNTSGALIGRYCGKTTPPLYISDSDVITIKYKKIETASFFSLKYEAVCEEVYEAPSGNIHTIGYPNTMPIGLTCFYLIKQKPGSTITLQLSSTTSDYLYYDQCDSEFLEIRDGDNENSTIIETSFDYDDEDSTVYSSSNTLWIRLRSSSSECTSTFMANYSTSTDCVSLLRNMTGSITFSTNKSQRRYCRWILQAPMGFFIQLYVTLLDFKLGSECSQSHVNIYENNSYSKDANLIGSYCGKRIPPLILIPSNLATITVTTTGVYEEQEFQAHYIFLNESKVCGGNFFSKTGTIKSPQYPHNYPSSSDCVWIISVDTQHQIELKNSIFKMRIPCTLEYLEIRNGGSPFSPLIGRFCGSKIPRVIRSHTNQLYMHLVSSIHTSLNRGKFMFTWESSTTGCGGKLTTATGAVASPNYPEAYHKSADCLWSIIVSQGSTIQLVFLDLDLESKTFLKKCSMDYIEVFDGSSQDSKSIGRFCGNTFPQSLISSNRKIDIYFKSDISTEGRGFNLHYRTICSNNFTGYGGVIESPNFPEPYPLMQECKWFIKVARKNTVNITFSHFNLEERGYHQYPYFILKPGVHINFLKVTYLKDSEEVVGTEEEIDFKTYHGYTLPDSINVPSDRVIIYLKTDTNLIGNGFRLEWVVNGCGGLLNKPGKITTPNYPNKYPDDIECEWLIKAPIGQSVVIKFSNVDVEKQRSCPYDVIKVFNGPDTTYPLLSSFCHMEKQIKLTSNGHLMFVQFVSDTSYSGRGFSADYVFAQSKCGGELSASEGTISSPNFPKNFNVGDYCEWLITVDANHLIQLAFDTFDLVSSPNCSSNYVKIYDGGSTQSAPIATLCDKPNKTFVSSSNRMLVVFKSNKPKARGSWRGVESNDELTSQGFSAVYSKACGARIFARQVSGILKLRPFSMKHAEIETECMWTILAPNPDQKVALTVTRFHLQSDVEMEHGLSVYGGESNKSPLIGKYSTSKLPPTIVSGGPALHIEVNEGVDFSAIYHIIGNNCGGTLTGLNGMFSPVGRSCEWTIQVAPGNEISVSFKEFNIPNNNNCSLDYLEVRQRNATGPLRGIFCGNKKPGELTHQGSLWFFFRTEKDNDTYRSAPVGFLAEYATSSSVTITGYRGEIASPLYPDTFSSSTPYTWKITVFGHSRIELVFEEFQTENFAEDYCLTPNLKVFDGANAEAPELGTFCGFKKPDRVESSSNNIFIRALMDSSRLDNKFLLKWRRVFSLKRPTINNTCGAEGIIDLRKVKKFNLTSPGFPKGYAPNLQCEWNFETESANSLRIKMISLSLGYPTYCFYDFVTIISDNLNKKVCHRSHLATFNASRTLKVTFRTNGYLSGKGFEAEITQACGGVMKESSGVITFDKDSPRDRTCKWKINVKAGRRIELKFLKFATNSSNRCDNFIMLKNGIDATSPNLGDGKYCDKPPILRTTGNNLYIEFNGNPNNTDFKVVYRDIIYDCGGSFALTENFNNMLIQSPNHPAPSEPFIECFWVIRSPPGTYLQVDFIGKFDFHQNHQCDVEAVELRDGGTHLSPLINKFCDTSPNTQFSSDNIIYVKYFTEAEKPGDGFLANISIASCGGTFKSPTGKIEWSWSPGKPHVHPNCTWNIIAPFYDSLNLDINLNGLKKNSFTCMMNGYFAVYEITKVANDLNKKLLTSMCNSSTEKHVTSSSNRVTIEFTNIMSTFKYPYPISISIAYNTTGKECSYTLNTEYGEFKSPNYPNLDYFEGFCFWKIKVPEGRRITVNITDFDLEKYSSTSKDGQSIAFLEYGDYFLGEIFYNSSQRIYKSSGNVLQVIFICEQSTNHRGFTATYSSNEETVCNQDFSGAHGRISELPGNPRYVCIYKNAQKSPINMTLALSINSTLNYKGDQLSSHYNRSSISVRIEPYGDYSFGRTLFSNDRPLKGTALVRTAYPEVFLELEIKGSQGNFSIDYEYFPCGGYITNYTSHISTPKFPKKYEGRLECAWVLDLPPTDRIRVSFLSLNLGENCEKSYVDVYNGKYSTSPKIGRFCNTNILGIIVSQKNTLLIEYHQDKASSSTGFNATFDSFSEGCGGTITDRNYIIGTPNYPQDYPNNAECRWLIVAPEGSHMSISSINRFQLETSGSCSNDYVEISDWKDEKWKSLGKWCGRRPPYVTSSGNKMLVVFRSNDNLAGSGFQLKWQMKCGGSFRASTEKKYITSPGYPMKYDNKLLCSYYISSRDKLVVEFEDFALEGDYPTCTNDNVTIFANSQNKVYCGIVKPPKIEAHFHVFIKFRSDIWIGNSGFKLSFKINECGETITTPQTITRNYSTTLSGRPYYRLSCLWNITAPANKTITMKFTKYSELPTYMSHCISNAVEIYDGSKFNDLLATICGAQNIKIPVITTSSNTALLSLKTMDRGQISFSVDISFTPGPGEGCGGTYKLNETKVILPPNNYTNADCQWVFEVQEGFKIEFRIESLKLANGCGYQRTHGGKNCTCSFIEIRDGAGPFSEEIDQFCSNTSYSQTYSTSWKFGFLRFYTDEDKSENNFRISVKPIKDICGPRELHANNTVQIITSPRYPMSYDANIQCRWIIRKRSFRQSMLIHFTDFDLTNSTKHEEENICRGDRIEIEEGTSRESLYQGRRKSISSRSTSNWYSLKKDEIMQICGKRPKSFSISTRGYFTSFGFISTSETSKGRGFRMEYSLLGCSTNYTQDSGSIFATRENNTECLIYITSSDNTTLSIYFDSYWNVYRSNCSNGYLEVYDGHTMQSTKLLRYCDYKAPNPVFGSTNKLMIVMRFAQSLHHQGALDATFLASSNGRGCGGKIFQQQGTITSPFYPNNYTSDTVCSWEINVPIGAQVKADFISFSITGPCQSNYLKIKTYANGNMNERTFCARDRVASLYSDNKMTVTYKSSTLNTGLGWLMKFRRVTNRYSFYGHHYYVPTMRPVYGLYPSHSPFPSWRTG